MRFMLAGAACLQRAIDRCIHIAAPGGWSVGVGRYRSGLAGTISGTIEGTVDGRVSRDLVYT